jgi:prolyl oligopeptidase PreP (S9A serine peptidase family)
VYDRCLISLSRGGADAVTVREFDIASKSFVKDGFTLPEAKLSADWRDLNSIYVATDFGAGSMTDSGYPRIIKEWKRGTPLQNATTLLEGKTTDMSVSAQLSRHQNHQYELLHRQITFYTRTLLPRRRQTEPSGRTGQSRYRFLPRSDAGHPARRLDCKWQNLCQRQRAGNRF